MRLVRPLQAVAITVAALLILTVVVVVVATLTDPTFALMALVVAVGAFLLARALRRRVRPGTILELDLEHGVVEQAPTSPLERLLLREAVVLRDVVDAVHRAAEDERVAGLVARLGNGKLGVGHAQEIREAIRRLRNAGKATIAFAESFGEAGLATVDYYLASAFEKIHLQPNGVVSLGGVVARLPFLRSLLDRVGVVPDLDHRKEYKAAKYLLTESGFTPPHEEATRAVLEDQFEQMVSGIAADRGLDPARVRNLIDRAPLLASEALEAGLVDRLSYRDEAYESAPGEGKRHLLIDQYLRRAGRPHRRGERIALIYGTGAINRGKSRFDLLTRGRSLGADDVAIAFREARENKRVRAIVFRVDSPGGSAVGSEVVRREVARARASGKPVVVSMGSVAGSGGYWISTPADRIVAQPGTVTGSIGVVGGKLAAAGAWRRFGVSWDERHLGRNATFSLPDNPYTDSERERLRDSLDSIYEDFKTRVAEGRSLPLEEVEELAKGRIWTGARAALLGLVDQLGGLETAVAQAKEIAQIPAERPVKLVPFPRRRAVPLPKRRENSEPIEELAAVIFDTVGVMTGTLRTPAAEIRMPPCWPR